MIDYKTASGPYLSLTEELLRRAQSLDFVRGFWIHGSRSVGRNTEDSDIDYAFIVENKEDEERLAKSLSDILEWKERPGFYPEQIWAGPHWKEHSGEDRFRGIGMHFYGKQEFFDKFDNIFDDAPVEVDGTSGLDRWQNTKFLQNQGGVQFIVVESIPLYDPENILAIVKEKALQYPNEFSRMMVDRMVRNLEIKLDWFSEPWIQRNKYNFVSDIREVLYYIATAHYAKNKAFMQNGLKRYHYDLESFTPDIKQGVDKLLAIDENFESEDKAIYLKTIIEKLKS